MAKTASSKSDPESPPAPVLVWFRDDLRVDDNPALRAAAETGAQVLTLYCLDEEAGRLPGGALGPGSSKPAQAVGTS